MIISRAEIRALLNSLHPDILRDGVTIGELAPLLTRMRHEAAQPDEPSAQLGWIRGADGITRQFDATIRKGDLVSVKHKATRLNGDVLQLTAARAFIHFAECDEIPTPDYKQWVPLTSCRKERR